MGETDTRTDAEVRASEAERVGNDAVERRAISTGNIVRNRRAAPDADVERAETRGYYRDLDGRRRIVGAGQTVPDGWERIGTADLADRQTGPAGTAAEGESNTATVERKRSRSRKGSSEAE